MHYTVPATHVEAGAAPESRGEISTTKPSPEVARGHMQTTCRTLWLSGLWPKALKAAC